MVCAVCGAENEKGFQFCGKCGNSLLNTQAVSYAKVDTGHYHSENELSINGSDKYTLAVGTFTINDTAPRNSGSDLYTADELNESEEEFDFSIYDEPVVSSEPEDNSSDFYENSANKTDYRNRQKQNPSLAQTNHPINNQSKEKAGSPYMYGQPMMYAQPQIIGYDTNGNPLYGQPMMYAQPQIIGYDTNGNPLYAPPMMYAQPQIIGYDTKGNPIYNQPPNPNEQPIQSTPNNAQIPNRNISIGNQPKTSEPLKEIQGIPDIPELPENPSPLQEKAKKENSDSDDFWNFFDNGKKKEHDNSSDDFFGKSSHKGDMGGISIDEFDFSKLQKKDKKKNSYMNDTPLVDVNELKPNNASQFNKMFMKQAEMGNSSDLQSKHHEKRPDDYMDSTQWVDASNLSRKENKKSKVTMKGTGNVNADDLEVYVPEHKKALMGSADHAVEAMPKKKTGYVDELDKIELPAYMQARKTPKKKNDDKYSIPDI